MRIAFGICIVVLGLVCTAQAADFYQISAKKDYVHRRQGESQDLPRGSTRLSTKALKYVFTVKRRSLAAPEQAAAGEWIVLVETKDGRLRVGTRGRKDLDPTRGENVIETDVIELTEREWKGPRRSGSLEDTLYGYGFRIVGADGAILGEKYSSGKAEKEIDWRIEQREEGKAEGAEPQPKRPPRPRLWR